MSAALPPLKSAPLGASGRRPSPCQVRGTSKNVDNQRQTTTNVRAGQSGYRARDQGLRGRRNRPYKAEVAGSRPAAPTRNQRSTAPTATWWKFAFLGVPERSQNRLEETCEEASEPRSPARSTSCASHSARTPPPADTARSRSRCEGPGPTRSGRFAGSWTMSRPAGTNKLMEGRGPSGSCSTTGSPSRSPRTARRPPSPATEG